MAANFPESLTQAIITANILVQYIGVITLLHWMVSVVNIIIRPYILYVLSSNMINAPHCVHILIQYSIMSLITMIFQCCTYSPSTLNKQEI